MKTMTKKKWELQKLIMFLQLIICPVVSVVLIYRRNWNTLPAAAVFSVSIDLLGMIICLLLFLNVVKNHTDISLRTGLFSYLISICGLEIFLSLCSWLVDQIPSLASINMFVNVAAQALSALMLCVTWQYLVIISNIDTAFIQRITKYINIFALLTFAASIGNIFGHYYFYVDEAGIYRRGAYFYSCYLYSAFMFMAIIAIVLFMDIASAKKRALLSFAVMPIAGVIVQSLFYGIFVIYPSFLCSLLYIYSNVFAEQTHELTLQKLQAMETENLLLLEQQKNQRIETELNMATRIQTGLLPTVYPVFPNAEIDLCTFMQPAKEVGGDFYDFFRLDDDHLALVIADVSGKGVPAALYMMITKALVKTALKQGFSPAKALSHVNQQLCDTDTEIDMFVTVWAGCLELSTGRLIAANAAHEYPAIRRAGGPFEIYKDPHNFVIGGMSGMYYKEYVLELQPGDTLFLYTDGVPEACSKEQKLFGTDRMIEALNRDPDRSSEKLIHDLLYELQTFMEEAEQSDDITMMAMKIIAAPNH